MIAFRRATLALSPLALLLSGASVQAQDTGRMLELVQAEADSGTFMGAVLVARGDEKLVNQAWGLADAEWNIANTPQGKFRIGSVTKQFTSVSILLLAEEGKIDLDAPIATYLEGTPEAWSAITVRNLIRHTSGIPNVTSLDDFGRAALLPTSQDEIIAMFQDLPLEFEPGSKFAYSNSGYVLLSRIVEKVSGMELGEFYQTRLFGPLGMTDTALDDTAAIVPLRVEGYSPSGDGATYVNADYVNMDIPTGAGALYSTTDDLLKWQRGLFGGKVLSAASLETYLTPHDYEAFFGDPYAHGVLVDREGEDVYYWHGGGIQGFNAWLSYDPGREVTVAVLANLNGGAASKLGQDLMTVVRGGEITLASERQTIPMPKNLAQFEGVYALSPDFKITVFAQDGRLMTQATGQGAAEIFPEAEDRFFLTAIDAQVAFQRDESGAVTGLTLFQNGREFPAAKE